MLSFAALTALAPLAKRALPLAVPVGLGAAAFLIGWLYVGHPRGYEAGRLDGMTEGLKQGREDAIRDVQREVARTARDAATARREAQRTVTDEMRNTRSTDGAVDPDRLRDVCTGDPDCRGERLLMDGADQLEPVRQPADD